MTADAAWRSCRAGRLDAETFGHGPACGLWFIRVNVMRDHLVLNGAEVSTWDAWRNVTAAHHVLSHAELQATDALARIRRKSQARPRRPGSRERFYSRKPASLGSHRLMLGK